MAWQQTISIPALLLSAVWPCCFAADARPEYEIKAAFLLNFTKFVEWPPAAFADSNSLFAICILGRDPFGRTLDDIVEGEVVDGRKLTVRRISETPTRQTCQLVFFAESVRETRHVLSALGPGVLTVGDHENFIRDGGMIGFVIDNRRVRFDINESVAETAGLKLSSKLLNVARSVEK